MALSEREYDIVEALLGVERMARKISNLGHLSEHHPWLELRDALGKLDSARARAQDGGQRFNEQQMRLAHRRNSGG